MPPWTFTSALSVGRSTRSRFRASWSIRLPSGFIARIASVTMTVLDWTVGPASMQIPMLAIVNAADEIAPLTSVTPFIDKIPTKDTRIIEHPGEIGVGLPHLGMLVGRAAYARVWPQIVAWLKARS